MEKSEIEKLQEKLVKLTNENVVIEGRYISELEKSIHEETINLFLNDENENLRKQIEELNKTIEELKFK